MAVIFNDTPKPPGFLEGSVDPEVRKIEQAWHKARAFRSNSDKDWAAWDRYYLGHHWNKPRAPWKSKPVKNFIFSHVETIIPIMTDSAPQVSIIAFEDGDAQIAEILAQISRRVWVDQDMDLKLPAVLKNTLLYGTGFLKVWFNPNLGPFGDVAISIVDTRHIYPSPGAQSLDDASYVIFAANVPLSLVISMYPEAEQAHRSGRLKTGVWDESLTVDKPVNSEMNSVSFSNTTIQTTDGTSTTQFTHIPRVGSAAMDRDDMVTLVEYWESTPEGKFVTVVANAIKLKGPYRPFKHDYYPFVKFDDYVITGNFWSMGEVQQLVPIQDFINERNSQLQDIIKITANPQFIADFNSGINTKALTNRPGAFLLKNQGTEARWNTPPQIPTALFDVQELDKRDFDTIGGVQDVTQGRRPVGIEAASAIVELQEAAQTRLRHKTRNMEAALRRLGLLVVGLVQQFYTEERAVRVVGSQTMAAKPVHINVPVEDGQGGIQRLNDVSVGQYDIEIGVGSTLPVSKGRLFTQYLQMYRDGLVDQRAVLEVTGMPPEKMEAIIARMRQEQQQLLALQQGMAPADQAGTASAEAGAIEGEQQSLPTDEELAELEQTQAETQLGV